MDLYSFFINIIKVLLKKVRADVQKKWCFFYIQIIIYYYLERLLHVDTKINKKLRALQGNYFLG